MEVRLLEKFEGRSSLSTWLIRITWNRWLDLKRRDKFRGELPRYEDDETKASINSIASLTSTRTKISSKPISPS